MEKSGIKKAVILAQRFHQEIVRYHKVLLVYSVIFLGSQQELTSVRYAERTAAGFILLVPKNIPEKNIDKLVVDIFASELV